MLVREILVKSGRCVHTVPLNCAVEDAVSLMAREKTSLLIVMRGESPVGVFTTRDILRTFAQDKRRSLAEISIEEVMTHHLITASKEDDIGSCLVTMLRSGIGYLPILEEEKVIGILSLRDLARHRIDSLTAELASLHEYLGDLQDALTD